MENVSQIILRQSARLPRGRVTLVNPAVDGLFRELESMGRPAQLICNSHGDFRRLQAMGADVRFAAVPDDGGPLDTAILVLPREKERLSMLSHVLSRRLVVDGRLWLAGPIRAGIKSSPRILSRFFDSVEKRDSARHCALIEAAAPLEAPPFCLDDYETRWTLEHAGRPLELASLPGVFAHGRLDGGTALLLEALESLRPRGRVLDFASGCGVVGICIKASHEDADVVLLDDSALAIESGQRSLRLNNMTAASVPSDGLAEVKGPFDWIVSNPPFHRGIGNDLDIAARFFRDAGTFLSEKGKILVVFNRHLPYGSWLRDTFRRVDCLAQNREFTVILASEKK